MKIERTNELVKQLNLKGEIVIVDSYYDDTIQDWVVVVYLENNKQYAGEKALDLMDRCPRIVEVGEVEDCYKITADISDYKRRYE